MNKPVVYKQNGVKQRADVVLTKEIATVLREMILSGEKIPTRYPERITIQTSEGERIIYAGTMNDWVRLGIMIPELNVTFRSFITEARQERNTVLRQRKEKELLADVEREFRRTMNLRTNVPVISRGKVQLREDGTVLRKESDKLLAIKMTTAQYLAERLDREKYGKIDKTQNEHLVGVFSLSELRRADKILKQQENE